jgi:hypothetical protein
MDAAAKKTIRRANAPQWKVAIGVGIGLALAAAPLAFKEVARDARLKRSKK